MTASPRTPPPPPPPMLSPLAVVPRRMTHGGDLDRRRQRSAALPARSRCGLAVAVSAGGEPTPSTAEKSWWRSRRLSKKPASPPRRRDRRGVGKSCARLQGCPSHQSTYHPRGGYRGHSSACARHFFSSATRSGSRSRGREREPLHRRKGS